MSTVTVAKPPVEKPKEVKNMSMRELFIHIYGQEPEKILKPKKHVKFERTDATEVRDFYDTNKKRVLRPFWMMGKMHPPAVSHIVVDGENVVTYCRKNKALPAFDKEGVCVNYKTIEPQPHGRYGRYPQNYFMVHDMDEFLYIMLSHLSADLAEKTGVPSNAAVVRLYDPNKKKKAEIEKAKAEAEAGRLLTHLMSDRASGDVVPYAIAYKYRIPTQEGGEMWEPVVMEMIIRKAITSDNHRPPHHINAKTFLNDFDVHNKETRALILSFVAQDKGCVRFLPAPNNVWQFITKDNVGTVTNVIQLGKFDPKIHGNDNRHALLRYMTDTENSDIVRKIEEESGFYLIHNDIRRPSGEEPKNVLEQVISQMDQGNSDERREFAYLKGQLEGIGEKIHPKTGLSKLRDMAKEHQIPDFQK